jgi:hypothetical protein
VTWGAAVVMPVAPRFYLFGIIIEFLSNSLLLGYDKTELTVHGLRSTASVLLNEKAANGMPTQLNAHRTSRAT